MSAGGALTALITTGMKAALDELGPAFERQRGCALHVTHGPSGALAKRVAGGEVVDLLIVAGGIDDLVARGVVAAASRRDIAAVRIGVAVRQGAVRPDIGTAEALRRALIAAKSVAYVDPAAGGASGLPIARMLERLGILAAVNAKAKLARGGTADMVSAIVARGDAEIGIQQMSEIMAVAGVDLVGLLPEELQTVTTYTAGIPVNAKEETIASALIDFLATPQAAIVYKAKGLEPA